MEPIPVFTMTLVDKDSLVPCQVFLVQENLDLSFYRVILRAGTEQQLVCDIAKEHYCDNPEDPEAAWEKRWVDIYEGMPTDMAEMLGSAIESRLPDNQNRA